MDLNSIEMEIQALEALKKQVRDKEVQLIEVFKSAEKEVFEGKPYREYINTIHIEEIKENVHIKIDRWNIYATYELENVILSAAGTIYEDGFINVYATYPKRTISRNIPKKYAKEVKHLEDICNSYKVKNPLTELKNKYNINFIY